MLRQQKRWMVWVAGFVLCSSFFAARSYAQGGGTLPLLLPGGGTLPLKLVGDSIQLPGDIIPPTDRLPTKVTLTAVTQEAWEDGLADLLLCSDTSANVTKHKARGTLTLDAKNYRVKGICYNQLTKKMEIVGSLTGEQSLMIGDLPDTPILEDFRGRMTVERQSAGESSQPSRSRFKFHVLKPEPPPVDPAG